MSDTQNSPKSKIPWVAFWNKRPLGRYWFILIFARPGNCKSLEQARISYYLFQEFHRTERKYPELKKRFVFTNQILREDLSLLEQQHGHLRYWSQPQDFRYCPRIDCWKSKTTHRLHDCDLLIDEGSTLFPADKYADTPFWLRKMWAQHRHNGLRIVMLTQDFKAVDINCRRMLWKAYAMVKRIGSRDISPTLPPLVKWSFWRWITLQPTVWGIYTKQEIDPAFIESDSDVMIKLSLKGDDEVEKLQDLKLLGVPRPRPITWWKVNLFDTTQDVKEYELHREFDHITAQCYHPTCNYKHVYHKLK